MMGILLWGMMVLLALSVIAFVALRVLPSLLERFINKVAVRSPYQIPQELKAKHARLFVADLHTDSLIVKRDLLKRHRYGHVDLPRLIEGNVALQVFAAVTKVPRGLNFERNSGDSDLVTLLAMIQTWPPRTWDSLLQRARYQAEKLERFSTRSGGQLVVVTSAYDLEAFLARREKEPEIVAGLLALEGVHALEGDIANLDLLYDAGFRMIGLTHFFDNEAGGSAHGVEKGGLTPFGSEIVRRVQEKHMLLDLAHASPQMIDDVLEIATAPVVVSHTGLRGTCDNRRNLSDDHIRGIAATGGVVGVAMFEVAVCGTTMDDTARAIRYGADLVGVEHLAVGSDFDGGITAPVDSSGVPLLTQALFDQGFTDNEVASIMGQNVLRMLRQALKE